jgi:hypothetical protein
MRSTNQEWDLICDGCDELQTMVEPGRRHPCRKGVNNVSET